MIAQRPPLCVEKVISECAPAAALRDHARNSFSCVLDVRRVENIVIDFSRQNDVAESSSAHPDSKSQALENGLNGFSSASETRKRSQTRTHVLMGYADDSLRVVDSTVVHQPIEFGGTKAVLIEERLPPKSVAFLGWLSVPQAS